ncbi:phosphodiesterase [Lachnospiraceae bacterium 62-35]
MKYMIASDIHGSEYYCKKLLKAWEESGAERLILLGDILYHGPRNDLPEGYAPKNVIAMLNEKRERIFAVRGNCDTEVDQMVLEFPIMADYALLHESGIVIYATHGHVFHEDHLPPLMDGDVLLHGHTHLLRAERKVVEEGRKKIVILNPGSVSIPKGGNPPTYAVLENGVFHILSFGGEIVKEMELGKGI